MKKLILNLAFILISLVSFGQTVISPENRIVVIGEATIEIPADKVVFNIKLEFNDSLSIQKAYSMHKEAETKLVVFLKQLNIPNKNISYSLISIGKEIHFDNETNKKKDSFGTNQSISVTIDDVKQYSSFMMNLITAGFTDVSSFFTSSKENDFHDILIEKAIGVARKKALSMAKASNRQIMRIVKVSDTDDSDPSLGYYNHNESYAVVAAAVGESSIMEIPQTVTKNMKVKVVFSLK
ncbi:MULTISPECIES: SIMPL domain-containing protein [unclassified Arcicella]|uniref:SIMPL domain-containing protein n=1 Tax=unclassified Arcicella TaxID=2644986 RepID=UPI0028677DDB|nr:MULTISPECIES: SIMPL domain-containing protein [unclassified Arcicella]MDR6560910.1 uncharacterized protein YggE [Arcicella sp. BE51]MDR6810794.1 uncharacterized protein YggE [Arcicella sp. BE140]MDR6822144.1 uncharacterized protein YggE [Arcicella sp. BE139]